MVALGSKVNIEAPVPLLTPSPLVSLTEDDRKVSHWSLVEKIRLLQILGSRSAMPAHSQRDLRRYFALPGP